MPKTRHNPSFQRTRLETKRVKALFAFEEDTTALLLCGEPIEEPIVGQGPFVMNTAQEIQQAILDYRNGEMGRLS